MLHDARCILGYAQANLEVDIGNSELFFGQSKKRGKLSEISPGAAWLVIKPMQTLRYIRQVVLEANRQLKNKASVIMAFKVVLLFCLVVVYFDTTSAGKFFFLMNVQVLHLGLPDRCPHG